jgi:hypothetical protein
MLSYCSSAGFAADATPVPFGPVTVKWVSANNSDTKTISCPDACAADGYVPVLAGRSAKVGGVKYYACRWNAASEGNRAGYSFGPESVCNASYNGLSATSGTKDCQCLTRETVETSLWIPSTGNCGVACFDAGQSAVITGAYTKTGTPLYVCRADDLAVGGFTGFNLAPSWQNACYTGKNPTGAASYMCQCNPAN